LRIKSNENITINSNVIVLIDRIKVNAKVIRKEYEKNGDSYGLEIINIDDKKEEFEKFIHDIQRRNAEVSEQDNELLIKL
jgi:hypothetical protein